jgi:hypothetical protein
MTKWQYRCYLLWIWWQARLYDWARLVSTLKAYAGCATALALLVVFVVLDRIFDLQTEGETWYE